MFGYLIVLPNSQYNSTSVTPPIANEALINITSGASQNVNSLGFSPSTITIVIGVNNTVLWTNDDNVPHTVTSDTSDAIVFSSDNLNPGDTFSFTFSRPGIYSYHCSYHPWMKGTIIVLNA